MQHVGPTHRADLATGLVCIVIGVAVITYSMSLPTLGDGKPGPGLFPGILGGGFVLFGLVLTAKALTAVRRRRHVGLEGTGSSSRDAIEHEEQRSPSAKIIDVSGKRLAANATVVVLAVVGYILLADILGYLITMFCVAFAIMLSLRSKLVSSIVTAIVSSLLMWVVFEKLLLVQLPDGLLVGW